jgi:acyl carrier protein
MRMTDTQLGLLVVNRMIPVPHLYNIVAEIELDPSHTHGSVAAALADVLAVQPALRLCLPSGGERTAKLMAVPLILRVLTHITASPADFDARRRTALADGSRCNLIGGDPPLLRATHLTASDGSRSLLLMTVHHIVFDGYSLEPFSRDLTAALDGALDVQALRPERETALRAELAAHVPEDSGLDQQAAELAGRVTTVPKTTVYPKPGKPPAARFLAGTVSVPLPTTESDAADSLCAKLRVTSFALFSAIFAAALSRYSGNSVVCFGTPLTARSTARSFELCGFFVNTLPIVLEVPWAKPFARFVRDVVAHELVDAMSRSAIPLSAVVRHAGMDRGTGQNPLFAAVITTYGDIDSRPSASVRAARLHGSGAAKFDLELSIGRTGGQWTLEFEHDKDLLPHAVVGDFAESTRAALARAAEQPEAPVHQLFDDAPRRPGAEVIDICGRHAPLGVPGDLVYGFCRSGDRAMWDEHGDLILLKDTGQAHTAAPNTVTSDDPVEAEIRAIWSELLGREVPVDQSLVEYGAHSLNVLTVVERLEERYGISVPILEFFRQPTVRALTTIVRSARGES